jgi:hypothetical protein
VIISGTKSVYQVHAAWTCLFGGGLVERCGMQWSRKASRWSSMEWKIIDKGDYREIVMCDGRGWLILSDGDGECECLLECRHSE